MMNFMLNNVPSHLVMQTNDDLNKMSLKKHSFDGLFAPCELIQQITKSIDE